MTPDHFCRIATRQYLTALILGVALLTFAVISMAIGFSSGREFGEDVAIGMLGLIFALPGGFLITLWSLFEIRPYSRFGGK